MITVNDFEIKPTIFPDRTSQVWKLNEEIFKCTECHVVWKFENEAELFHLAQLKDLLDQKYDHTTLYVDYLPYARQDKTIKNEHCFALRTFAHFLNQLHFSEINCWDVHSSAAKRLIHNLKITYPKKLLSRILKSQLKDTDLICYPDEGALKKYAKVYKKMNLPFIHGIKQRDQLLGHIVSYDLNDRHTPCGKTVLIIDDICDGGSTFEHLSSALIEVGALEVNLFVTHGLFTKGLVGLRRAGISRIFTMNGEVS